MPPVSSQGSRAALVTWSVVTGILFVVATIVAIYFYVNENKTSPNSPSKSSVRTNLFEP